MMEVVVPLPVEPVPPLVKGVDQPDVVQVTLRNDMDLPAETLRLTVDLRGQFLQNMPGAEIEDTVNCVDPQRVQMILA